MKEALLEAKEQDLKLRNEFERETKEKKAEIQQNMDAMADAQTGGLAVYTRRANEAEAKINE